MSDNQHQDKQATPRVWSRSDIMGALEGVSCLMDSMSYLMTEDSTKHIALELHEIITGKINALCGSLLVGSVIDD